jgi:hypothetical protein
MHGGASSAMTASRGVATLVVVMVLTPLLVALAMVVDEAAPNGVASPINRVAATSPHLLPGPSVQSTPISAGIAMTTTPPLSLAQRASRPLVPPTTCGTLILGQHTILLATLTNLRCMMPIVAMIGFTRLTDQVWTLLALVKLLFPLRSAILP